MIYVSVQPDTTYFHWQVEVFVNNFISVGINPNKIEVVFLHTGQPSVEGLRLQQKYNTCRFFFYLDDRPDKSYIPSLKPYGMFKHLQAYPELNKQAIFYHDADIIFRERIDEQKFERDDAWYLSDTISYVGYEYCVSKGVEQFLDMVDLVRVGRDQVKARQHESGGAQYIVKNTRAAFWYKVYEDSHLLYKLLCEREPFYVRKNDGDHPIQKWCAEMWTTIWNAWLFNYKTVVHPELDFCFATDPVENYYSRKILHNAGVTEAMPDLFFKGAYTNDKPFGEDLGYIREGTCSRKYVDAIKAVGQIH